LFIPDERTASHHSLNRLTGEVVARSLTTFHIVSDKSSVLLSHSGVTCFVVGWVAWTCVNGQSQGSVSWSGFRKSANMSKDCQVPPAMRAKETVLTAVRSAVLVTVFRTKS